jgi:hypothetical protein
MGGGALARLAAEDTSPGINGSADVGASGWIVAGGKPTAGDTDVGIKGGAIGPTVDARGGVGPVRPAAVVPARRPDMIAESLDFGNPDVGARGGIVGLVVGAKGGAVHMRPATEVPAKRPDMIAASLDFANPVAGVASGAFGAAPPAVTDVPARSPDITAASLDFAKPGTPGGANGGAFDTDVPAGRLAM